MRILTVTILLVCFSEFTHGQQEQLGYTISDSSEYEGWIASGRFGVLSLDGMYVDTIELSYGLKHVPGGALFRRVQSSGEIAPGVPARSATDWFFHDGARCVQLKTVLSGFHNEFSELAVIDSVLYYWGGGNPHHAFNYDFRTGTSSKSDSVLYTFELGTDFSYLTPPRKDGQLIRWTAPEKVVWTTLNLEIVREAQRERRDSRSRLTPIRPPESRAHR